MIYPTKSVFGVDNVTVILVIYWAVQQLCVTMENTRPVPESPKFRIYCRSTQAARRKSAVQSEAVKQQEAGL